MADETEVITTYRIKADADELKVELKQASKSLRDTDKAAADLDRRKKLLMRTAKDMGSAMAGLAGVAAAAGTAYIALVKEVTDARHQIVELSRATGFSTESLTGMRLAALSAGRDLNQLLPKEFAKRMLDAASGSASMQNAFKSLGVEVVDSNGHLRSQDDVLAEVIGSLQKMENQTEKAALTTTLLGEKGVELMASFGNSSFESYVDAAERLGYKSGPEAVRATEDLNDAFSNFSVAIDVAKQALADTFSDDLVGTINTVNKTIVQTATFLATFAETSAESGWKLLIPFKGTAEAGRNLREAWDAASERGEVFEDVTKGGANAADAQAAANRELGGVLAGLGDATNDASNRSRDLAAAQRDAARAASELQSIENSLLESIRQSKSDQLNALGQLRAARKDELRQLEDQRVKLLELQRAGEDTTRQEEFLAQARLEIIERYKRERDRLAEEELAQRKREAHEKYQAEADAAAVGLSELSDMIDEQMERYREIRAAQADLAKAIASGVGQMTGAILGFVDESSAAYKGLFLVQQAAAAAGIIVDTQQAIMAALTIPPPLGEISAAARAATGAAALATVLSTTIGGLGGGASGGGGGGAPALPNGGVIQAPSAGGASSTPTPTSRPETSSGGSAARSSSGGTAPVMVMFRHELYDATVPDSARIPGSAMNAVRKNGERVGHTSRRLNTRKLVT